MAGDDVYVVSVQNRATWLLSQIGQLIIAVGLLSLIFNYAYRFAVDWTVSSPLFYASTLILALIVFVIFRREYLFVNKFEFGRTAFSVRTLLGVQKTYPLADYRWVPSLHKVVNFPEKKASLSFFVRDTKSGKDIRNYSWAGFSADDFRKVSMKYGWQPKDDFDQKDFGRA